MKLNRLSRSRSPLATKRISQSAAISRPAIIEPLEDRQLMSLTIDIRVAGGGKAASATSVGQVINLEAWAIVSGNTSGANDGFQSFAGSILSTKTSATNSVAGNLSPDVLLDYGASGAQEGTVQDLNGDGSLDIGSNNNANIAGFLNARAGGIMQNGVVSGNTQALKFANLSYTVTNLHNGSATNINARIRNGLSAGAFDAVWLEDGAGKNDQLSTVLYGAPVVITDPNLSPPAGVISGTVTQVVNGSSSAFPGTTVFLDSNTNGVLDSGELSTTTASNGTYSFSGLSAGTYYLREVVPSGYSQTSPSSTPTLITLNTNSSQVTNQNFVDSTSTSTTGNKLSGSVIGTAGSYKNGGNTIAKAFDNSLSTFFDGPSANGNWAGLNLGGSYVINKVTYSPRSGWAGRMVGGIFQGSHSATFSSGVTNLATITSAPAVGSYTSLTINNTNAFEFVRYLSPSGSYGDVAELQFFGTAAKSTATKLTGTVIGTAGSYNNNGNTIAKAVDGNLASYFDGATANGNWVGLNLGSAKTITQISYAPRSGFTSRMVGGIFQVSNTANFSSGVVNVYTITSAPTANTLTTVKVSVTGSYQYVRYLSPNGSYGNVAEINFYS